MPRENFPIVYICSPYAGDVERNVEAARRYCRFAYLCDAIPYAPHLLFPQFMSDDNVGERSDSLRMGKKFMLFCDEVWAFYNYESEISSGMRDEINYAKKRGIVVRHYRPSCVEVVDDDLSPVREPEGARMRFVYSCERLEDKVGALSNTIFLGHPLSATEEKFCALVKEYGSLADAYLNLMRKERELNGNKADAEGETRENAPD